MQFLEQQRAPQDSDKTVRVPQRECEAQANILYSEYRQRVSHRPQTTRHDSPNHQMGHVPGIGEGVRGAANQGRQTPTRDESAEDHHERDHQRRNGNRNKLCRGLGPRQPERSGHATEDTESVKCSLARIFHCTRRSSAKPNSKTAKGTQNCTSFRMARHRVGE